MTSWFIAIPFLCIRASFLLKSFKTGTYRDSIKSRWHLTKNEDEGFTFNVCGTVLFYSSFSFIINECSILSDNARNTSSLPWVFTVIETSRSKERQNHRRPNSRPGKTSDEWLHEPWLLPARLEDGEKKWIWASVISVQTVHSLWPLWCNSVKKIIVIQFLITPIETLKSTLFSL